METFTDTPDPSEEPAPADVAPPAAAPAMAAPPAPVAAPQAVDNSAAAEEVEPASQPQQEMSDEDLPRDITPGAMGGERALLMQLLGLDVNHPFDEAAEAEILRRVPSYAGVVDKPVWRELYKENPVS
jgi:hypothetical protein